MADIDLTIRHPDYDRMLTRWILEYDFYRGGIHVLQPSQWTQVVGWYQKQEPVATDTPSQPDRGGSRFEWQTTKSNSYLHKHPRERLNEWKTRQAIAHHIPLFRPTVNIFASAVLKTGPDVVGAGAPKWLDYFADVDLNGTDISLNRREILAGALTLGRMHSITDMSASEEDLRTMRQQREAGIRAYSSNVYPFDLVNWSVDSRGRFRWVQLREDMPDKRIPGQPWPESKNRYRCWFEDHWELWEPTDTRTSTGKWAMVASETHPCNGVPLSSAWAHRGNRTLLGVESPLCDVADVDRSVFNKFSLLDELLYKQTFSILAIGRREGTPLTSFSVGPGEGIEYDAEAGPPVYISPDAAQTLALWTVIKETIALIKAASEAGRGAAEQSLEARSAAAIGAESSDRSNVMAALAEGMEQFEKQRNAHVAAWEGSSAEPVPEVKYSRRFDLRSINQQLADLVQVKTLEVGAKVLAVLTKPVIVRMLKEAGASEQEIADATGSLSETMVAEADKVKAAQEEKLKATSFSADAQADARAEK